MAAPKKNAANTAAKATPVKKPTAAQKREAQLEARIAQLEAKLGEAESREDRLARLIEQHSTPQAVVVTSAATPVVATPAEPVDPYDADSGDTTLKARLIRNLRSVHVNMRLDGGGEKPYRVSLKPRGHMGDTARIPAKCTDDTTFVQSLHSGLFEIITRHEHQSLDYSGRRLSHAEKNKIVDPNTGLPVQVGQTSRDADRTVSTTQYQTNQQGNVQVTDQHMGRQPSDQQAQQAHVTPIGPRVVSMPGSDPQLTAQFQHEASVIQAEHAGRPLDPGTGRPLDTVHNELAYQPLNPHATPTGEATGASAMPPEAPVVSHGVQRVSGAEFGNAEANQPGRQVG